MKVFLDTNVLVTVLLREAIGFDLCVDVLNLAARDNLPLFTTSVSLGAADYMTTKKWGAELSEKLIGLLIARMSVLRCDQREVTAALTDKSVHDFEDGLQYYAALHGKCKAIVTNDTGDYYFSQIPVYTPAAFLQRFK